MASSSSSSWLNSSNLHQEILQCTKVAASTINSSHRSCSRATSWECRLCCRSNCRCHLLQLLSNVAWQQQPLLQHQDDLGKGRQQQWGQHGGQGRCGVDGSQAGHVSLAAGRPCCCQGQLPVTGHHLHFKRGAWGHILPQALRDEGLILLLLLLLLWWWLLLLLWWLLLLLIMRLAKRSNPSCSFAC